MLKGDGCVKGYFMSSRDHNSKLIAIAWITNQKGVRIGSWKKEIMITPKNKYEADYLALDLLFDAVLHCQIKEIEIINFNWRLHQQLISKKQSNSYLSKYNKRFHNLIKSLNSIAFKYEKVS